MEVESIGMNNHARYDTCLISYGYLDDASASIRVVAIPELLRRAHC
jgi:hypothetical protein